jgi:hypothetical protein
MRILFSKYNDILLKYYCIFIYIILSCNQSFSQNNIKSEGFSLRADTMVYHIDPETDYSYAKPLPFRFITRLPSDFASYCKQTFTKKNSLKIGAMIGGTALLVWLDQPILDAFRRFGDGIGIEGTAHQKTIFEPSVKIGNTLLKLPLGIPQDLNSSMYFIGDGWTHTGIILGFWSYGKIVHDNRALQTASEIGESILLAGITTQILKHLTGRQSPYMVGDTKKNPGGIWHVFPNQLKYSRNVPNYDAFPSGHLATAMATFTVIAENYPEYAFIKPLGYTLLTALSFSMLNNGVHWISDYPLSLAMGYSFAKIAVSHDRHVSHHKIAGNQRNSIRKHFRIEPVYIGNSAGIRLSGNF